VTRVYAGLLLRNYVVCGNRLRIYNTMRQYGGVGNVGPALGFVSFLLISCSLSWSVWFAGQGPFGKPFFGGSGTPSEVRAWN